LKYKMNQKA